MDKVSLAKRSEIMAKVRSRDTKPELAVRRMAFSLGCRYRVNVQDLPGKPDIAVRSRKKAIFVHGCFWHQHGCEATRAPGSNLKYWNPKLKRNIQRDAENIAALIAAGWDVLILWECELKNSNAIAKKIKRFWGK